MKNLVVSEIFCIYELNSSEVKQDDFIGIYFKINYRHQTTGFRFNIDNSGQNVEIQVQNFDELLNFIKDYGGQLSLNEAKSNLSFLKNQIIKEIYFAFFNYREKISDSFTASFGDIIGLQVTFENNRILTFYNYGDEGAFTFDYKLMPKNFPFEDVIWKRQNYLLTSLENAVSYF